MGLPRDHDKGEEDAEKKISGISGLPTGTSNFPTVCERLVQTVVCFSSPEESLSTSNKNDMNTFAVNKAMENSEQNKKSLSTFSYLLLQTSPKNALLCNHAQPQCTDAPDVRQFRLGFGVLLRRGK